MSGRVDIIGKALQPEDRLGVGGLVCYGKKADHVAELVHLLTIDLHSALDVHDTRRIKMLKRELERCYRDCERAVKSLAQGGRLTAAAGNKKDVALPNGKAVGK